MVIATVLLLADCRRGTTVSTGEAPPNAVAVHVADIREETIDQPISASGAVAAKEETPLAFKIGGVVADVLVHEGESVRAGQPLATLDLREIDALVSKAKSAAVKAERDQARVKRLYADSVATLQQLEDATTALEVAHADIDGASVNRRYAAIVAPAAGVILRRVAEPGQLVSVGSPVVVFGNTTQGIIFRAGLPDRDVVRLTLGSSARVVVDAWPDRELRGTVRQISRASDPRTGTYLVEVAIDNPQGLASGMVGRVEITSPRSARLPVVPIEALLEGDGDHATVFTVGADGKAKRVPVTVALMSGNRAAIRSGLGDAKQVITDGAAYLNDGSSLRIVP
jgi:RND family efflux transporter MFP subunit